MIKRTILPPLDLLFIDLQWWVVTPLIYAHQRLHHHPPKKITSYPLGDANPGPAKHPTTSTNGKVFEPLAINISDSHRLV